MHLSQSNICNNINAIKNIFHNNKNIILKESNFSSMFLQLTSFYLTKN